MKERFYSAVNDLNALRKERVDVLYYDAEHEKRRKEQLIKQWNRTEQQVVSYNILQLRKKILRFQLRVLRQNCIAERGCFAVRSRFHYRLILRIFPDRGRGNVNC